jgi:cell volume regulation protein A
MGLRGAVPIVLALFPMMYGLEDPQVYFNIAFFVVLVSLLFQGLTVALVARWLRLEVPPPLEPVQRVTLDVPGHYEHEMVGFVVREESHIAGREVSEVRLPEGVFINAVLRDGLPLQAMNQARLAPGDFVYFLARPSSVAQIGALLDPHLAPRHLDEHRYFGEFTLNGNAVLGDVAAAYGIEAPKGKGELTLAAYISLVFHGRAVVGDLVALGTAQLVVREIEGDIIRKVGLRLPRAEA